jgi:Domain of unknown function (DUF7007)
MRLTRGQGFKLEAKHNVLIPPAFRRERGWYEEDCDAAIPVFFMPLLFKPEQVHAARESTPRSSPSVKFQLLLTQRLSHPRATAPDFRSGPIPEATTNLHSSQCARPT